MHFYGYDSTMIFLLPALILALYAEFKVNRNFKKYSAINNKHGYTGADVAKQLLMLSGINDVTVQMVNGNLTDNYNPKNKTLNLSQSVYASTSLSAVGVAAHETGHAIQHQNEYFPLVLRSSVIPLVIIYSTYFHWLIIFWTLT